jgi:hypothetical protein
MAPREPLKNANGHGAGLAGTGEKRERPRHSARICEKRERPVNENLEAMEVDFFSDFHCIRKWQHFGMLESKKNSTGPRRTSSLLESTRIFIILSQPVKNRTLTAQSHSGILPKRF